MRRLNTYPKNFIDIHFKRLLICSWKKVDKRIFIRKEARIRSSLSRGMVAELSELPKRNAIISKSCNPIEHYTSISSPFPPLLVEESVYERRLPAMLSDQFLSLVKRPLFRSPRTVAVPMTIIPVKTRQDIRCQFIENRRGL